MLFTLPIPSPFPTAPSYCDASGAATEQYPFNPNGSLEGIAALCSPDGRHLAMMPHPERCFLMWQNPWCAALGYGDVCWAAGGHAAVQLCRGLDAAQRQGAAPWGCGQLQ